MNREDSRRTHQGLYSFYHVVSRAERACDDDHHNGQVVDLIRQSRLPQTDTRDTHTHGRRS